MSTASVEILHEAAGFVVANKPPGMLSEGGGERELDLEQAVSKILGKRAWCCHRLDRPTSGVVVLGKGRSHSRSLAEQFERGLVRKEYWLLVEGMWDSRIQKVESLIASQGKGIHANVETGGKKAVSTFRLLAVDKERNVSWLSGLLKTGRTHQLRLHALRSGCPVLGDTLYGREREDGFFGLHARSLKMRCPESGEPLAFEAEPPKSWKGFLARFES